MAQFSANPISTKNRTMIPYLTVKNADRAIEFYKKAFGAFEVSAPFRDARGKITHAEMGIGDSVFKIMDESASAKSPETFGGTSVGLALNVDDAETIYNNAIAAGAKNIHPVIHQFYGDRIGKIEDPFGHRWSISTHMEEVSREEIQRRVAELNDPMIEL